MAYVVIDRYPENKIDPLLYEVKMLNDTYRLYFKTKEEPLRSAVLESFLLHARILIDFLENNRNKQSEDDLTCSDFTDIHEDSIQGQSVQLKKGIKTTLNKHLAHLTLKRANAKAQWDIAQIRTVINDGVRCFLDKCGDSNFPEQPNQWKLAFLEQTQ